jgi:acetyltransferase-like isoleucine patch superfamily enzyme
MPVIASTANYTVLHDSGRDLCFVGNTQMNNLLYNYFKTRRNCIMVSLEDVENSTQSWIDIYQFMSISTRPRFKYQVKNALDAKGVVYFSVIGNSCVLGENVSIGYNTFLNQNVSAWAGTVIGDHCSITDFIDLAHDTVIGNCCQIGPFCKFSSTTLGQGVVVNSRAFLYGPHDRPVVVADYTNINLDSRVLLTITEAGTYNSNRRVSDLTSLDS